MFTTQNRRHSVDRRFEICNRRRVSTSYNWHLRKVTAVKETSDVGLSVQCDLREWRGSGDTRNQRTRERPKPRKRTDSSLVCRPVGDMVDRFVQSLSLLILLSVSGLNGGLSTKMSFTVAAGGAAGIAGDAAIEQGGSAWRASYLPLMLARPGLRCSGTCAEDTGDPNRQV